MVLASLVGLLVLWVLLWTRAVLREVAIRKGQHGPDMQQKFEQGIEIYAIWNRMPRSVFRRRCACKRWATT